VQFNIDAKFWIQYTVVLDSSSVCCIVGNQGFSESWQVFFLDLDNFNVMYMFKDCNKYQNS
jgi:hypothetical protein